MKPSPLRPIGKAVVRVPKTYPHVYVAREAIAQPMIELDTEYGKPAAVIPVKKFVKSVPAPAPKKMMKKIGQAVTPVLDLVQAQQSQGQTGEVIPVIDAVTILSKSLSDGNKIKEKIGTTMLRNWLGFPASDVDSVFKGFSYAEVMPYVKKFSKFSGNTYTKRLLNEMLQTIENTVKTEATYHKRGHKMTRDESEQLLKMIRNNLGLTELYVSERWV